MNTSNAPDAISLATLARLQKIANLMDKAFTLPGTNIRFGVDSLVGLIPVVGDSLAAGVAVYIYSFAKPAGVPWHQRMRMMWNIFIDWSIGLIPVLGDVFDVGFKANSKNVDIIRAHIEKQMQADHSSSAA